MTNRLTQVAIIAVAIYAIPALLAGLVVFGGRKELTFAIQLLIALAIAVGSVLVASAVATYLHRSFTPEFSHRRDVRPIDYGPVFEGYVVKFSWFIAPIIGSYGLFRLVELVLSSLGFVVPEDPFYW